MTYFDYIAGIYTILSILFSMLPDKWKWVHYGRAILLDVSKVIETWKGSKK